MDDLDMLGVRCVVNITRKVEWWQPAVNYFVAAASADDINASSNDSNASANATASGTLLDMNTLINSTPQANASQMEVYRKAIADKIYHKFRHLTEAFRQMDQNHDGKLSKAEIVDTVANFNLGIPYEHVIQLIDHLADTDHDGEVDYNEFAAALKRKDVQEADLIP